MDVKIQNQQKFRIMFTANGVREYTADNFTNQEMS